MFGWLGALFSSKRVMDEAMDTVKDARSGLDHLIYTDQEKVEHGLTLANMQLERVKLALQESSIRSMTRRILSVCVVGQCVFLTNILAVLILFNASKARIAGIKELLAFWATPLALVLGFYLGYYGVQKIFEARKKD